MLALSCYNDCTRVGNAESAGTIAIALLQPGSVVICLRLVFEIKLLMQPHERKHRDLKLVLAKF